MVGANLCSTASIVRKERLRIAMSWVVHSQISEDVEFCMIEKNGRSIVGFKDLAKLLR